MNFETSTIAAIMILATGVAHIDPSLCKAPRFNFLKLLTKAAFRYLFWALIGAASYLILSTHPYYMRNAGALAFIQTAYKIYLFAGLPYFLVTLYFRSSWIDEYNDGAVRLLAVIRRLARSIQLRNIKPITAAMKNPRNKAVILLLPLRLFYLPIMIPQISSNFTASNANFASFSHQLTWSGFLLILGSILWLVDSTNASAGYFFETRWQKNHVRSVNPFVLGWIFCLACYSPFNSATGTVFPWLSSVVAPDLNSFLLPDSWLPAIRTLQTIALIGYVAAHCTLGSAISNLTYKGVQTRGFYAVVRHPAYAFKLLFWSLETITYLRFYTGWGIFAFFWMVFLYSARAVTEEWHLKQYPEYREYMAKVRWRLIPRIF